MEIAPEQAKHPPPAPAIPRRLCPRALHWVGMAVIFAPPVAAIFSAFEGHATVSTSTASLEITVEHPTRCRFEMIEAFDIQIRNRTDRPLEQISVRIDPQYMDGFAQAQFTPELNRPYEIRIDSLAPGEIHCISGEIQGERYGRFSGNVAVAIGRESTTVGVSTFIFP